jgi:hypothetical protein
VFNAEVMVLGLMGNSVPNVPPETPLFVSRIIIFRKRHYILKPSNGAL